MTCTLRGWTLWTQWCFKESRMVHTEENSWFLLSRMKLKCCFQCEREEVEWNWFPDVDSQQHWVSTGLCVWLLLWCVFVSLQVEEAQCREWVRSWCLTSLIQTELHELTSAVVQQSQQSSQSPSVTSMAAANTTKISWRLREYKLY